MKRVEADRRGDIPGLRVDLIDEVVSVTQKVIVEIPKLAVFDDHQ